MRCEAHVRFLGGGGAVMRCRYPTIRPTMRQTVIRPERTVAQALTELIMNGRFVAAN